MNRPRLVVLGMMTKIPVGGVVWQTLHYLEGFRRLGCDVHYVEAHARTPSMFMAAETDDGSAAAAEFLRRTLERIGMADRWALWALHDDATVHGAGRTEMDRWLRDADAVINLHGGTDPALVDAAIGRLVYLETDPVQLQVELHDGVASTFEFLDAHEAHFTYGELWGRPSCRLPVTDRYRFHPTRQPVILDWWGAPPPSAHDPVTTVANWHQPWREVVLDGERYGWSKDREFEAVLDLPAVLDGRCRFELALSGIDRDGADRLRTNGWGVLDGLAISSDPDRYRTFVSTSVAEFTMAKDQNVRLRSGWFSDRSATYLAAGRAVVTQSTGFEDVLPTGAGLWSFADRDGAVEALDAALSDPVAAGRAARELAEEYFGHDRVLTPLLEHIGLRPCRGRNVGTLPSPDVALRPIRRRPLRLQPDAEHEALTHPLPVALPMRRPAEPDLSIVVVTWNHLDLTRLCLGSLLADSSLRGAQIVVVDNGSTDGTPDVLDAIARRNPAVHPIRNRDNRGFAAATNQGIAAASSTRVVLLNNDTVCAPGSLVRLARHLDDPAVGVVGALAPRAGNEAHVDVDPATFREYCDLADERARRFAGQLMDVPMVTLFCAALRADVLSALGPLDESYGRGMFEDDDYAARLATAGLRRCLALDVLVHHFGEGSFGDLFASGTHSRVFAANRERFETTWSTQWRPHRKGHDPVHAGTVDRVRALVEASTPEGSTVAVLSGGDDALCEFAGRSGRHLPALDDGRHPGHHPADDAEAAAHLDRAVRAGARFLLVPPTSRWWLSHYRGLSELIRNEFTAVAELDGAPVLYERSAA